MSYRHTRKNFIVKLFGLGALLIAGKYIVAPKTKTLRITLRPDTRAIARIDTNA